MNASTTIRRACLLLVVVMVCGATTALAYPSRWDSRCASCHTNDTPSCNGCHHHAGTITAVADQPVYAPGSLVSVTLNGGTQHGWIRGLLYDQQHVEIDRATGPTGMGDDSLPNPVTFPVTLTAPAPAQPGTYTWRAAWFGGETSGGGVHLELGANVTIVVEGTVGVPDEVPGEDVAAWGAIKALFR
jgi:hypothetical protein